MSGKDKIEITNVEDMDTETHSTTEIKKNVYYLYPSDEQHQIIIQVQLKEKNYDEWAKTMRLA